MNNNIFCEKSNSKRKKLSSIRAGNPFKTIRRGLRNKHHKNVLIVHLNINSLRNKFKAVNELMKDTFNIFLLCESKVNFSFPDSQFFIRKD